ncbi:hypothetical protein BDZ94DRAFT_788311 [Collybia nuda]|uniref:Uncharacterized protein n=1 Tax=Collybia nuda TaxID=64659 RepID=A0A9P5Y3X8_9AGAR|nr:hypothetical protein BDZ94DRAFT_788311 [Collybia nuda]
MLISGLHTPESVYKGSPRRILPLQLHSNRHSLIIMKFSALTLSTVAVMALGVAAQASSNTSAPTSTGNGSAPAPSPTGNGTAAPPSGSNAAFALAAGSEGFVAAGVFAGLLAALV